MTFFFTRPALSFLVAVLLSAGGLLPLAAQSNGVHLEFYGNIAGNAVSDLTNNPAFPSSPTSESIRSAFEAPSDYADNYGQRMSALLLPPTNGTYVFWIASDDNSALYLSADESPTNRVRIAFVTAFTTSREWNKEANQQSAPIALLAGQRYYIEALQKDGSGGDNLAVTWASQGSPIPANGSLPIQGTNLIPYGLVPPVVSVQPTNVTVAEGGAATFTVQLLHLVGATFQWTRNGTNIPGAASASYTLAPVALSDTTNRFRCFVANAQGNTNSNEAVLTVVPDTTRPLLSSVANLGDNQTITVYFSEPVEAATAEVAANYTLNNGLMVFSASLAEDGRSVVLTTSPFQTLGTTTNSDMRFASFTGQAGNPPRLLIYLGEVGDVFIDDLFLARGNVPEVGTNLVVTNGIGDASFEIPLPGTPYITNFLTVGSSYNESRITTTNAHTGTNTLHVVCTNFSTTVSKIIFKGTSATNGETCTVSFWYKPTFSATNLYVRMQSGTVGSSTVPTILTPGIIPPATYVLTVNNVRDRAVIPNTILANSQISFTTDYTPLDIGVINGPVEPIGASSRRGPLVLSEIMYHPPARVDARNLEFIELYNSQEWFEDISGYRISGAIDYTFPTNTLLPAHGYVLLAAVPADIQAVYGIGGALAYTGSLPNNSGTLRIRNRQDAIVWETTYDSSTPWPVSPDGAGHSLVLAQPSFGEGDPRAWAASDLIGGSPRTNETASANPYRTVLINEFLANSDGTDLDYVELFNYSTQAVNLAGCVLTDDETTNKFVLPPGTIISARSFLVFDENQLGFSLSSGGETIYLKHTNNTRVLDMVRFDDQSKGIAMGRYPDGAPGFHELQSRTPGSLNTRLLVRDVVINEIMHSPVSGDLADEFVELFNRGTNAVNLSKWTLKGGISFTFPTNAVLPAGGYVVAASSAARLMSNYPNLNSGNTFGDYSGKLGGHERVTLTMPEDSVSTNQSGGFVTNKLHIAVDAVTYDKGGRWGQYADGGGSSLELIDAHSDHRLAANWSDSDETGKSTWVTVESTGVLDNGQGTADALQIVAIGAGEWLVDDVEVFRTSAPGVNLISNPFFTSGMFGWFPQGNMNQTAADAAGGTGGSGCLHVRATGAGNTGANRVRTALTSALGGGENVTIRAKVRWLKGNPEILFRLKGSWLEATAPVLTAHNLGTPGASNSIARINAGPAISGVSHSPVLPAANQSVTVSARVHDPDGLAALVLKYRVDPATNYTIVAMNYSGAGYYSAVIPGQSAGVLIAFLIEAQDAYSPRATARFPNDAPRRECLVRFGDLLLPGNNFANYRFWMTQDTLNKWIAREQLSNDPLDVTFLYGTNRIIYNAGGEYSGSPYHSPGFNSPIGNGCDYLMSYPKDDPLLGTTELTLQQPGNGGGDGTLSREQTAYWIGNQLGIPSCHRRTVNLIVNGVLRNTAMEDVQQPGSDLAKEWYPDDPNGEVYKIQIWFEFDDAASGFSGAGCDLGNYTTTGGVKKLARYRWNWAKRAYQGSSTNYTSLYGLVDTINNSLNGPAYTAKVQSTVDVDQWYRTFVTEHIVGNNDSYAYGGGQNMYAYKPVNGPWKLLIWDIDFALSSGAPASEMFSPGGRSYAPDMNHPPFLRLYYQAMIDAVNGPLLPAKSNPLLDARYAAFVANGLNVETPASSKDFLSQRRDYILTLLTNVAAPFGVNGGSYNTNQNFVTFSGTAPVGVRTITINGVEQVVTWTALTTWSLTNALQGGTNLLTFQGLDPHGTLVTGATGSVTLNVTLPPQLPQDYVVINEIMYHPAISNAAYIEIYNSSTNFTFDLSNCQLNGASYTFPAGSFIGPLGFIVLANNRAAFAAAYGTNIVVFGEFNGNLQTDGETLSLIKPGATPAQDLVIDRVRYETVAPWPVGAGGTGSSIQLIDPKQDHSRPGNWSGNYVAGGYFPPSTNGNFRFASYTGQVGNPPRLLIYLGEVGDVYIDDLFMARGNLAEVGTNLVVTNGIGDASFEAPLLGAPFVTNFLTVGSSYNNTRITATNAHSGANSLNIVCTNFSTTVSKIIFKGTSATNGETCTLSFWYKPTFNATNLYVRMQSGTLGSSTVPTIVTPVVTIATNIPSMAFRTPGATNSVAATLPAFPPLWINEIQPENITGIIDSAGQRDPWLELYNSGTNVLSLSGYYLANTYTNLGQWAFPGGTTINPGEFKIIFADAQTAQTTASELHTSFRLTNTTGSIALSRLVNGQTQVVDYLNYNGIGAGRSYGDYPDGQAGNRQEFYVVTPGATNNPTSPPLTVFINEWMADNITSLADPADGKYQDWFELYNPGTNTVSLAGFYLTDTVTNKFQYLIPAGYTIPPHGYLLVWADNEPQQNGPGVADLHVNFKLSATGEAIALFAADGTQIDAVVFGAQAADVSRGHFPDGTGPVYSMTNTTPRAANLSPFPNTPPLLAVISNKFVHAGQTLLVNAVATDSDLPAQNLTYSLAAAPDGAGIDPSSGLFFWTPTPAQTPGTNTVTVRVTDSGLPSLSATRTFTITVVTAPSVTGVNRFGGNLVLNLQTYPGRTYRVEFKDDLNAPSWNPLGADFTAAGSSVSITNSLSVSQQRFYRAVVVE